MTQTYTNPAHELNPVEAARLLAAFSECSHEVQNIVLEMAAIIGDANSTDDERTVASDAMIDALFPGVAADTLQMHRELLNSPEAMQAAADLASEQAKFSDRVRGIMKTQGVTQEKLADLAGIGQPAISNLLNRNCRPQRRTVERIANALHVNPKDISPDY